MRGSPQLFKTTLSTDYRFCFLTGLVVTMPDCRVRGPKFESYRGSEIFSGIVTTTPCVYRDSHCDIPPWARAAHPYCSASVDSAFHRPWDGIK